MTETVDVSQETIVQDVQPSIQELAAFAFNQPLETPAASGEAAPAPEVTDPAATPPPATDYIKDLGFTDFETAKAEIESLRQLKTQPATAAELAFANEESKKVYQSLKEGKIDEALEVYNAQKRIDRAISGEINKDSAANIIKLKMELSNKLLSPEEIEFEYRQQYLPPKEPVQRASEPDDEFEERHNEWVERVQIAEQKRVVAAKMAIPELQNLKQKIELPDIQAPQQNVDKDYEAYKASNASADQFYNTVAPLIKSLKESDVSLGFTVNDANNKMQFDITIVPDAADFEAARQDSLSMDLMKSCYDKDGKFIPQNLQRLALIANNFDKYGQAIARQAVNAERKRVIEQETAGNGVQRNFQTNTEPSELDALKAFAFQRTG